MAKSTQPEPKNKGGRPRKEIDYLVLENLCKLQATGAECASVLGMDYSTLADNLVHDGHVSFPEFFKKHSAAGRASLRRIQWKQAESGSTAMAIFLGKNYLGQSDKITHGGDEGNPIQIEIPALMAKLKRMAETE